jgi:2-polyprenyl-3-methyl-5-hydroxy-6-metoxy-1,4-benzoquinol methylase
MKSQKSISADYWSARKDSIYLYAARLICEKYGKDAMSVLDVGSNGTPTLEWHRSTAKELVSLDLRNPYVADSVVSIERNFFDYFPETRFDLVTCFQVLEHIPDAKAFAKKLLDCGKILVTSVPYKWPAGACKYHIHDPVTNAKMFEWFDKKPRFTYVAREFNRRERLIHVY